MWHFFKTCMVNDSEWEIDPSSSMSRMDSRLPDLGSEIRVGLTMDVPMVRCLLNKKFNF